MYQPTFEDLTTKLSVAVNHRIHSGRCSRCLTDMPGHALTGRRCANELACVRRERRMIAGLSDDASWWSGLDVSGDAA